MIHFGCQYFKDFAKIFWIPGLISICLDEVSTLNPAYYAVMAEYRKHKWRNVFLIVRGRQDESVSLGKKD